MYMPRELLTDIFATSSAKTLVRLRCVCKSWRTIIDDPDFVSMHIKLSRINNGRCKLLGIEKFGRKKEGRRYSIRDANTLGQTDRVLRSPKTYTIYGNCDGLLLLHDCSENFLRLWNPSIRKSLRLPSCPLNRLTDIENHKYLFGFSPQIKDYKIFATTKLCSAVYTLGDQQWSVRRNNSINPNNWHLKYPYRIGLYSQGGAHWLGNDTVCDDVRSINSTHCLVSFHFDTEKVTFSELPFVAKQSDVLSLLFLLRESLAIFCISAVRTSIWVLKQDNGIGTWTLWFSGNSSLDGFSLFNNSSLTTRSYILYYESDDGACFICERRSYNIASCEVRAFGNSISKHAKLETYLESLVLCKGFETEDLPSYV